MSECVIAKATDLDQLFLTTVEDVARDDHLPVSEPTQVYLAGVLTDAVAFGEAQHRLLSTPLPFALEGAKSLPPREKFETLRLLGDHVLLRYGYFAVRDGRGASPEYLLSLGAEAYQLVSKELHRGVPAPRPHDVFRELAGRIHEFAQLLRHVALTLLARSTRGTEAMVAVWENWLHEGSPEAARLLRIAGVSPFGEAAGIA
jgi:hypothetical protein